MKGWRKIKIEELGKVVTGNTPPRKNPELYGSHTPFIKPTDISEDTRYTLNPEECYSELGYKKYIKSLIPKGATCVVTIGSIGKKITQAHCDCFINQAMNAVIPNENFDPNFVYYLLKHNLYSVKALDSGTASGRENVSKSSFSNIEVYVPIELEKQIQIGKILSVVDDLIENNLQRIKLLEETILITFNEWFVKLNIGGLKLEIDCATGLPLNWEKKNLNEVYEIKYGKNLPQTKIAEFGNYPVYGASGIMGFYDKFNYKEKIVLITSRGNGSGHIHRTHETSFVTNNSFAVTPFENYEYLKIGFNKEFFGKLNLKNYCTGSAQPQLTNASMNNISIVVPERNLIERFNIIGENAIEMSDNLRYQNSLLKETRDVLLPRLLSGTIPAEKAETKMISIAQPKQKEVTWEFKEAVLIAMLTEKFGSDKFPLGRKRYTKLSYLFHRHADNQIQNYLRKAAGPYNPKTKYQGPEKIAHQNGYVADHKNGNLTGFIAGKNIASVKTYFNNYWNLEYLNWLDTNFHYKSNDQLELYTTVDNAMLELLEKNKTVNVEAIKQIIKTEMAWKAKLEREIFSDVNIQKAIAYLPNLFQYS